MRRGWTGALGVVLAFAGTGCVDADKTDCGDLVCPAQLVCMDSTLECVNPERIDACATQSDGDDCSYAGVPEGSCSGGLCVPLRCGDGRIDGAEQCDGDNLGGVACTDLGFYDADSVLSCSSECRLDTSACTGFCGDTIANGGEACDGGDLAGLSCIDFGYYQAAGLSCTSSCVYDTALCESRCGDGVVNGGESCDGEPSIVDTCVSLGFAGGKTSCSPTCTPQTNSCFQFGWTLLPSPTAADLHGVWAPADDAIIAVGDAGTVAHFDGDMWLVESAGTSARLNGVWGATAGDVWAVGDAGTLAHYDGATWTVSTVGGDDLYGIYGAAADDVWAVGAGGALLHYDGDTWSSMSSDTTANLRAVWVASPSTAFAVGDGGAIIEFDGAQWGAVASPWSDHLYGIGGTGPSDVWAVGTDIGAVHYDGATWTVHGTYVFELRAVIARAADNVLGIGRFGDVSHYDGIRWRSPVNWTTNDILAMAATPSGRLYAVGRDGTVLTFTEVDRFGVASIPHIDQQFAVFIRDLHVLDPNDIYGLDARGRIYHYNGSAWSSDTAFQCCVDTSMNAMSGLGAELWAVGTGAHRFDGTSWQELAVPSPTFRYDVWVAGPDDVFTVGVAGTIDRFDGTSFVPMTSGTTATLFAVHGISGDDVYAGGEGIVLHWDGASWTAMPFPSMNRVTAIYAATPTDVFVTTLAGEILHYDGSTWTFMRTPKVTELRAITGTGPDDVFASGEDGTLLHYDGDQWYPLDSATVANVEAIAVDSRDLFYTGNGDTTGRDGVARHVRRFHCPAAPSSLCQP